MTSTASRPFSVSLQLPLQLEQKIQLVAARGIPVETLIVEALGAWIDLVPKERAFMSTLAKDMVEGRPR